MATKKGGSLKKVDNVLITSVSLTAEVAGILGVANGGTGQSTFVDGQLLIGNTAGNTLAKATLTQGTGVTITNGAGSITIAIGQAVATTSTPEFARIGIGAAAHATHKLLITGGTVTADTRLIDATLTWNNSGVSFTAIKADITNTASAAGSKIIDLMVGGVSQFSVDRNGTVAMAAFNALSFASVGGVSVLTEASLIAQTQLALKGYKGGLAISWVSTTQVKVGVGAAHVESVDKIVQNTSEQTLSPSLSASSFHYIYLTSTGTLEVSTTAPATPYYGFARSKASNPAQRCIGFFLTNASSQIQNFDYNVISGAFKYLLNNTASPYRVLSAGTAQGNDSTVLTDVDCSAVVPPISRLAQMRVLNYNTLSANATLFLGAKGSTRGTGNANVLFIANPSTEPSALMPLDANRIFAYIYNNAPSPGAAYIDMEGCIAPL